MISEKNFDIWSGSLYNIGLFLKDIQYYKMEHFRLRCTSLPLALYVVPPAVPLLVSYKDNFWYAFILLYAWLFFCWLFLLFSKRPETDPARPQSDAMVFPRKFHISGGIDHRQIVFAMSIVHHVINININISLYWTFKQKGKQLKSQANCE